MSRRIPRQSVRLQDRDYELLEHLMRYRVTTRDVLHRLFFSDSEPNAVLKVTSRLTDSEYLARHPLVGTNVYFTLGIKGTRVFGIAAKHSQPLGLQSLFIQMGMLEYCCREKTNRKRLRVSEIQEDHPGLLQRGLESSNYVVDADAAESVLQFVRIDGGGTADHVLRKLHQDLSDRQKNPLCNALIQRNRFRLVCVTYSQDKAK